jgi:hypothetical protein
MIQGTHDYPGALWPVRRMPPNNTEFRLERFIDYLLKPAREGLGLPSLHFLRQVLRASPRYGDQAEVLVRQELVKELINFDAIADQEHESELLKGVLKATGRPGGEKGVNLTPLPKVGTPRQAARLAKRRPDLAERVRAGKMRLATALKEAGIRKTPDALQTIRRAIPKLTDQQIRDLIAELSAMLD